MGIACTCIDSLLLSSGSTPWALLFDEGLFPFASVCFMLLPVTASFSKELVNSELSSSWVLDMASACFLFSSFSKNPSGF